MKNAPVVQVVARALHSHRGNIAGELDMTAGDIVTLRHKVDDNWYYGDTNSSSGLVPANMVQVINQPNQSQAQAQTQPQPQSQPQSQSQSLQQSQTQPLALCRALYDFEANTMELEDCKNRLTFLKVCLCDCILNI